MRDIEIKNDITQARLEHDINSPDELPKENDDGSVSGDDALMSLHVKPNDYKADDLRRLMKAVWDEEKLPPPDGPDGRGSDGGKI